MDKRRFRTRSADETKSASYPTLEEFDEGRRSALRRIGAAVLGLGSLGALLGAAGCGDRALYREPDQSIGTAGLPPLPDARIDPPKPEGGIAPQPDSRVDQPPPEPDWTMGGVPRMPDAGGDTPPDGGADSD